MWFEDGLSYDNARLSAGADRYGTFHRNAGLCRGRSAIPALAHDAADHAGRPVQAGGYRRASASSASAPRAFDQQPLEATATISACLAAWRADGDAAWRADAARAFAWFLGDNDLSLPLVDLETGSCRDGLHPDRANENRGGESVVSYLLSLAEIRQLALASGDSAKPAPLHVLQCLNRVKSCSRQPRTPCHNATFLNRQALHLRPDPARVVVRPFKPATEPRDLNPTDKTRANHIVDRVLALDPEAAASQLADVLENFQGRHRNLLATFEARADEMEEALRALMRRSPRISASWSAPISCTSIPSKRRPVQSEHRRASRSVRCAGRRTPLHPEPSRGRRRAHFFPDVSLGIISAQTAA